MIVKIGNKDYTLKYTFNSMRLMKDVTFPNGEAEMKPFEALSLIADLFYGALNNSRKQVYSQDKSDELLEKYLETNELETLSQILMDELNASGFIKANKE